VGVAERGGKGERGGGEIGGERAEVGNRVWGEGGGS